MQSESEISASAATATQPGFDTRLVAILRDDLPTWQNLNAARFLVSGIAATDPTTVGQPCEDGSGNEHLPMFRQTGLVFAATRDELRRAYDRAREIGITTAIFTVDLFSAGHDDANRAAVRAVSRGALSLVGIAFRAEGKTAIKVVKGLTLRRSHAEKESTWTPGVSIASSGRSLPVTRGGPCFQRPQPPPLLPSADEAPAPPRRQHRLRSRSAAIPRGRVWDARAPPGRTIPVAPAHCCVAQPCPTPLLALRASARQLWWGAIRPGDHPAPGTAAGVTPARKLPAPTA